MSIEATNCVQAPEETDEDSAYLMFSISSEEGTDSGSLAVASLTQINRVEITVNVKYP